MKTRLLTIVFASLLSALPAAQGEVLIYAGTFQRTQPETRFKPVTTKCFFISDPGTGQFEVINYGKINGQKEVEFNGPYAGEYFGGNFSNTAADLYVHVEKQDGLGLLRSSSFARGLRKTVQISLVGGTPVTAERARTLRGALRSLVVALGGAYLEATYTVTLDTERTVDANVSGRTFAEVRSDIVALLAARGFQ